jgi:polysaccharide pyruvyl transferase WcaK-like protein
LQHLAETSPHGLLSGVAGLRDVLAEFGEPTQQVFEFLGYVIRSDYETLEVGISALSFRIAALGRHHTCVVPTEAAAVAVRALFVAQGIRDDRLRILVGEIPEATAHLPSASFDHVVLSAPFAFPGYFAAAHAAMRLVKYGQRLTIRGAGVWTVEQLRNFLRADPDWDGMELVSEDAIDVSRQPSRGAVSWREQPYILLNSPAMPNAAALRARMHQAEIRSFSTTVDTLRRRKIAVNVGCKAGLVGYYGFGNYGDELFRLAFEAGLPELGLPVLFDIPRRPYFLESKARKMERVDAVVIGGGDLIIPGYWTDLYFENEFLSKPIFVHGVGVPSWTGSHPGVVERMGEFFRHPNVKYINVRDVESKEWVEKHLAPNLPVELSPDIVCGVDLGFAEARRVPGEKVFGLITRKQPPEQMQLGPIRAMIERARQSGYRVRLIIAGSGPVGENDYAAIRRHDLPVDEVAFLDTIEGTTRAIMTCDVLASMKFHGCVVGLMAGIPTMGLITTDKFNNFYRSLGIEHLICHYFREDLPDRFDLLAQRLPQERIAAVRNEARAGMARLHAAMRSHGIC